MGPEGLAPSALLLGEYPKVHIEFEIPSERATLCSRARISDGARRETEKTMA